MLLEKKNSNRSSQFFDSALVRNQVKMTKKQDARSSRPRTPQFFPNLDETGHVDNSRIPSQIATPIKRDQNQQTTPRNDQKL